MSAAGEGQQRLGERLVVIDGHAIIYRAYFAMARAAAPLTVKSTGEPVGAVYQFSNTLRNVIEELQPTHIALALDVSDDTTFRRARDPNYKAHRDAPPEDLPPQIDRCREVAEAFSIPVFEAPGFEADDVLATLADQAAAQGVETWIATLDSDLLQLVRDDVNVFMFRPYQRDVVRYDSDAKVRERYGIDPIQVIDYKAIVGDTSDNIPGVKGLGDKGAVKLLNTWRTLEEIYEHLDEVKPAGTQKKLREQREVAFHSKWLATINHEVPVQLDLDAASLHKFDRSTAIAKFEELEFRSLTEWASQLGAESFAAAAAPPEPELEVEYDLVRDEPALRAWVERAAAAPLLAVDLETSALDPIDCQIAGYALADAAGRAAYIPVGHRGELGVEVEGQLDAELVREALRPVLEDPSVPKVLHNAKFDTKVLARHGIQLRGLEHDTMLVAYLLTEPQIGLKALAQSRLGVNMTPIEELIGKGRKQKTMLDVPAAEAGPYAAADADMTLRLASVLVPELEQDESLAALYRELELPLIPLLVEMELAGVTLDATRLEQLDATLDREIDITTAQIYEDAGHEFNIGSPKQLSVVLFEELSLPKTRKTSQGFSTDAQQLERLAQSHPIVEHVLGWRELTKLRSTYVESLPPLISASTGRIHTDYNQTVAATGRLSSERPNLQNIPVRTEMGRQIRAAFVPRAWDALGKHGDDVCFVSADYSQIELRVLAHLSDDPGLIEAFNRGEDIHSATASAAYGVTIDDVQPEMRRVAKMMNFGVIYGLTAHGLSQRSGMARSDAQAFIDSYFGRFARVAEWIEEIKASTRERGYAETLLGRRRFLPQINSSNFQARLGAERMAVNMPVQGTAADVMKKAMLHIDSGLKDRELRGRMLLQVHDELIFELPGAEVDDLVSLLQDTMPTAIQMVVPLQIDVRRGANWRDLEPLAPLSSNQATTR